MGSHLRPLTCVVFTQEISETVLAELSPYVLHILFTKRNDFESSQELITVIFPMALYVNNKPLAPVSFVLKCLWNILCDSLSRQLKISTSSSWDPNVALYVIKTLQILFVKVFETKRILDWMVWLCLQSIAEVALNCWSWRPGKGPRTRDSNLCWQALGLEPGWGRVGRDGVFTGAYRSSHLPDASMSAHWNSILNLASRAVNN